MTADLRVVLAEMRERVDAFPQSVKGKPWVHPCVDLTATLDAVEAVLGLAEMWEARGESNRAYAETVPDEEIAEGLIDSAYDWHYRASDVRRAITDALGGA